MVSDVMCSIGMSKEDECEIGVKDATKDASCP